MPTCYLLTSHTVFHINGKTQSILFFQWFLFFFFLLQSVQSLSHVRLCDLIDCSTPGFPVLHCLLELAQTHVHWVMIPSHHLIFCHPFLLLPSVFPASGSSPMCRLFASGGQSIGASVSASVLPVNIQDWFPLDGLVGSPCSPRDSQESPPAIWKYQFFSAQPSLW